MIIVIIETELVVIAESRWSMAKEGTTQGDPLAMAIYVIGIDPLILIDSGLTKQVWYANDVSDVSVWYSYPITSGEIFYNNNWPSYDVMLSSSKKKNVVITSLIAQISEAVIVLKLFIKV